MTNARNLAFAHLWVGFVAFAVALLLGVWQMWARSPLPAPFLTASTYFSSVTAHGTATAYVLTTFMVMGFGYYVAETALARPLPAPRWAWIAFALGVVGTLMAVVTILTGRAAVLFTYFLLDGYMRTVAPYWSQKDLIATYYRARRSPEERLVAFQMYWRGETFYTKNEIYEGPQEDRTVFDQEGADDKLKEWLGRNRGHRHFFLFERGQQGHLQQLLPIDAQNTFKVLDESNNKFSVAQADL